MSNHGTPLPPPKREVPNDPRLQGRPFAPQVNDERNNPGRFDLFERRKAEDRKRIDAVQRAQVVSLLTRTLGRTPTESEVAEALKR